VYAIIKKKRTTGNALPPPNGNGETQFFHVMLKMLPDANGTTTSFNTGEIQSFTFTQNMAGTKVEKMDSLEVHIFVQDHSTKYIYNSNFISEYTGTLLNPPQNLTLQDNGDNTVTVAWESPAKSAPSGYNIYMNGELIQTNYTGTSYVATLTTMGLQSFKVNAIYAEGVSVPASDYIVIDCSSMPPTDLKAEQIEKDVVLTWKEAEGGSDFYNVYLDGTLYKDNLTETTCTVVDVPAGEHVFGVTSITDDCESGKITVTLNIEDDCDVPDPESFGVVQEGADVVLTWEPPTADVVVDSYNIYLDGILQDNTTELTYTFVDAPEGTHLYGVSSVIEECESDVVEKELTITGISEMKNNFSIYPNPVSGMLNIRTEETITDCQIFNIQGQLIYSTKSGVKEIATDGWASGIYIIRVTTEKGSAEKRFVKN
jgi:uncharacterized protein YycO